MSKKKHKKNKKKNKKMLTACSMYGILQIDQITEVVEMANATAEKIMAKREKYFEKIDGMTDDQIEALSIRWHALANRYQRMIAKILVRRYELTGSLSAN